MNATALKQILEPFQDAGTAISVSDWNADDMPLIFVNKGFETLTGYSEREIIGKNCRFMQGPETNPKTVTSMRDAIQAGIGINACLANYRADGSLFHNLLFLAPITGGDGSKLFLGCQYDITNRIQFANIAAHIDALNGLVDLLKTRPSTTWQVNMDTSHLIAHMMANQAEYYLQGVNR